MWEPDSSAVVSHDVRDLLLADALLGDLAELETGLVLLDLVRLESALGVNEDSEIFICSFNRNNVHDAEREFVVSSGLAVDLDQSSLVLHDLSSLVSGEGVLESLLEEDIERNAFSELVGTGGWSSCVDSLELSEIPRLGSGNSLHNLSLTFITLGRMNNELAGQRCVGGKSLTILSLI